MSIIDNQEGYLGKFIYITLYIIQEKKNTIYIGASHVHKLKKITMTHVMRSNNICKIHRIYYQCIGVI
jgi:hypothetical protein